MTAGRTAKLTRNVALVGSLGTWGVESVPILAFQALAPRLIVIADRDNPRDLVAHFLKNVKTVPGSYGGIWFGVPDASETAFAYARRVIAETRALDVLGASPGEVMLDLEANWGKEKIREAVWYVLHGYVDNGGIAVPGLTRLVTVTCEPQQDWSVFPWQELLAMGVAAVYIQCYGEKRTDRRDPLYCTAVALGSGAAHGAVKCMVQAASPGQPVTGLDKDGRPAVVGTYPERLALTGSMGWAFYLADWWGQPAADPATLDRDVAAYGPLIGGRIPTGGERRRRASAYR